MHAVFLGVVKHHTKLLLTQTNTPYYIGSPDHLKLINVCLLKIRPPSCRSHIDRIDVRNHVIGLGKSIIRPPTQDESIALESVGYAPLNLTCFEKMKLNGVKYECVNDQNYKFCNSVVFGGDNVIGIIKAIINFCHNNENVSGIIIQRMRVVKHTFGTEYIDEVTLSNELCFLKELSFIKPAVKIHFARKLYVLKQTNCWETD
ncbi:hypothetical protein KQX54_009532 [Cotesia glomerata]|uniref:Uncharacterized protein n=1 Tax=Cotesia glomerata TaxID=32391 RepID=A0AAV7HTZ5_COTGL|nr:hypothetical protein KQX54_009532 [Cotesia glomerata]